MILPISPETMQTVADRLVHRLALSPPGPRGTVRVELVDSDRAAVWTVRFSPEAVSLAPGADADAVVRLRVEDAVRLAAGAADVALLYLSGRLEVLGNEHLVLDLGTRIALPDLNRPLIAPSALDPIAVSEAIAEVGHEHLSAVMSGGFRSLILGEVFGRLPEFLIAERAERVRVAVMFEIERPEPDGVDRYVVRVHRGQCSVEAQAPADAIVDATLVLAGHEFLRLVLGHLNPVRGVMSGQIRVRGQMLKALGFNSVMRIPGS